MEKEKTIIQDSEVLIPFSILGNVHAFLGPFPRSSVKSDKLKKFFPCLCCCKPRASDTIYELSFMDSPHYVLRSSPTINNEAYINW